MPAKLDKNMSNELLSKDQIDTAYQRFLEQNPQARARVNEITQQTADALGIYLSELRLVETSKALSDRATALGMDSFEYMLKFAVETDEMRQQILQARDDDIARALGLKW